MRVLIARHGAAVDPYDAEEDAHRWLTHQGRSTVWKVGKRLEQEGIALSAVFTSPLVRAVQTAENLALALGFPGELEVWSPLAGGTTARALAPLGLVKDPDADVLFVGHEPLVRAMSGHLLGDPSFPAFRTAGVVVIEWDGAMGNFSWGIDPSRMERTSDPSMLFG